MRLNAILIVAGLVIGMVACASNPEKNQANLAAPVNTATEILPTPTSVPEESAVPAMNNAEKPASVGGLMRISHKNGTTPAAGRLGGNDKAAYLLPVEDRPPQEHNSAMLNNEPAGVVPASVASERTEETAASANHSSGWQLILAVLFLTSGVIVFFARRRSRGRATRVAVTPITEKNSMAKTRNHIIEDIGGTVAGSLSAPHANSDGAHPVNTKTVLPEENKKTLSPLAPNEKSSAVTGKIVREYNKTAEKTNRKMKKESGVRVRKKTKGIAKERKIISLAARRKQAMQEKVGNSKLTRMTLRKKAGQ